MKHIIKISFKVKNPDATWGADSIGVGESLKEAATFALAAAQIYNYSSDRIKVTSLEEANKILYDLYEEYGGAVNEDINSVVYNNTDSDIFGGSYEGSFKTEKTTLTTEFNGGFIIRSFIKEYGAKKEKYDLMISDINDLDLVESMLKRGLV